MESGAIWLSDTPEAPGSRSWGNEIDRFAHWARFFADGRAFTVVNVHLDHESSQMRVRSARLLRERCRGALLLGDINAEPGSEAHDILSRTFRDAHPPTGAETMIGEDGVADARLDGLFVPPRARVVDAGLVGDEDERPSDHLGLVADVEVRRADEER